MTTETETQAEIRTETEFEEVHVFCCVDFNALLCGSKTNGELVDYDAEVTCIVCRELDDTDFCPKGLNCEDNHE
jgi:hypothetical protein